MNRLARWVDQQGGQSQFAAAAATAAHSTLVVGVVLVMNMNAELTVEGVSGIGEGRPGLRCDALSRRRRHQNSRTVYLLGLVRVQDWDGIEPALQWLGLLASHQGHVRQGGARSDQDAAEKSNREGSHQTYGTNCSQRANDWRRGASLSGILLSPADRNQHSPGLA